jgi:hypothetical protein
MWMLIKNGGMVEWWNDMDGWDIMSLPMIV